ncbi:proline dehydrogenase family protein [Ktedonospora formicarum]|uniref:proline dehydrogenase n=1 Tax=Ktedonospora formicarum TaxID=2778364 RepID=A0A8J3MPC8_9CHLR|nr:proline dehydrogenase family protein [Ktedonospora formicarum]GHO43692.1 proline dehydrogenase [Ktedonospora formicarum]
MLKDTLLYLAQNQRMRDFVVHNRATRSVSRRFVAGETLEDAILTTRKLNQRGNPVALDFLGENVFQESEAHEATRNYIAALNLIKQTGTNANISIKLTALGLDISKELCEENLDAILTQAREYGIFVCIDMEASNYTGQTVAMALKARQKFEQVGTVIQSYLYRSKDDIEELIKQNVRVRIVKGAYKEPPSVAFPNKKDVDDSYIEIMKMLLSRGNFPAIATHDERILGLARMYVRDHGIAPDTFEFQMLYGIRNDLQSKLVKEGFNVRVYVPYGAQWYPYLMRRMAERPANLMFVVSGSMRG